jgi:hypothetical protein
VYGGGSVGLNLGVSGGHFGRGLGGGGRVAGAKRLAQPGGADRVVTVRRPLARTAPRDRRASLGTDRRSSAAASQENHRHATGGE